MTETPPWQMTGDEWEAAFNETKADYTGGQSRRYAGMGRATSERGLKARSDATMARQKFLKMGLPDTWNYGLQIPARHRQVIKEALRRGYPVPAHVLAEYPDLHQFGRVSRKGGAEQLSFLNPSPLWLLIAAAALLLYGAYEQHR